LAGISTWKRDRDMLILFVLILGIKNYEVFPFIPLVFLNKIYTTINIIPKISKRSKYLVKGMLASINIADRKFPVPCMPVIKKMELLLWNKKPTNEKITIPVRISMTLIDLMNPCRRTNMIEVNKIPHMAPYTLTSRVCKYARKMISCHKALKKFCVNARMKNVPVFSWKRFWIQFAGELIIPQTLLKKKDEKKVRQQIATPTIKSNIDLGLKLKPTFPPIILLY